MDNLQRRDSEMLYVTDDKALAEQAVARILTQKLNTMDRSDFKGITKVAKELLQTDNDIFINPPFYCDYGTHIEVGKNIFINYNCTILDVGKVRIGDNCMFAPNVSIYTAGHPVHPAVRNTLYEYGIDITIGNNVWIGGNVVICPGVTIGDNSVIGAGSTVTKDIPSWCIAAGNPCRVIREITDEDLKYYYKDKEIDGEALCEMQKIWREKNDDKTFPFKK